MSTGKHQTRFYLEEKRWEKCLEQGKVRPTESSWGVMFKGKTKDKIVFPNSIPWCSVQILLFSYSPATQEVLPTMRHKAWKLISFNFCVRTPLGSALLGEISRSVQESRAEAEILGQKGGRARAGKGLWQETAKLWKLKNINKHQHTPAVSSTSEENMFPSEDEKGKSRNHNFHLEHQTINWFALDKPLLTSGLLIMKQMTVDSRCQLCI